MFPATHGEHIIGVLSHGRGAINTGRGIEFCRYLGLEHHHRHIWGQALGFHLAPGRSPDG